MGQTPAPARRTMDENEINRLEQSGDTATLARALRNLIVVTDDATRGAQAAAHERQEYVPTTLHKDDIYRALDVAHSEDATAAWRANPSGFYDLAEEDPGGSDSDDIGNAYRAALAVMEQHDDWDDDLPSRFTTEQAQRFTSAAVELVGSLYDAAWFTHEGPADVDAETRGGFVGPTHTVSHSDQEE
jgi:hypothetical protein